MKTEMEDGLYQARAGNLEKLVFENYGYNQSIDLTKCKELKTLVYNKEFRLRNFGSGKIGGVFTLGEATTEQIAAINEKVEALKVIKADGAKKRETLNTQILKKEKLETTKQTKK